jgi:hypothetical protein
MSCAIPTVFVVAVDIGAQSLALGPYPIEHQPMRMDVEIAGRAEALDERDRSGVSLAAFEPQCAIRNAATTPVNALQHR